MQHYMGEGSLDAHNAIQLLHTIFSLYNELRTRWKRVVKLVWAMIHIEQEIPKEWAHSPFLLPKI
jgi:hypothetical protein